MRYGGSHERVAGVDSTGLGAGTSAAGVCFGADGVFFGAAGADFATGAWGGGDAVAGACGSAAGDDSRSFNDWDAWGGTSVSGACSSSRTARELAACAEERASAADTLGASGSRFDVAAMRVMPSSATAPAAAKKRANSDQPSIPRRSFCVM